MTRVKRGTPPPPPRVSTQNFGLYCTVYRALRIRFRPREKAAAVIYQRVSSASLGEDSLDGTLTLGSYLIQHHRLHCKHGVMVDTPEDIDRLEAWYKDTIESQGTGGNTVLFAIFVCFCLFFRVP